MRVMSSHIYTRLCITSSSYTRVYTYTGEYVYKRRRRHYEVSAPSIACALRLNSWGLFRIGQSTLRVLTTSCLVRESCMGLTCSKMHRNYTWRKVYNCPNCLYWFTVNSWKTDQGFYKTGHVGSTRWKRNDLWWNTWIVKQWKWSMYPLPSVTGESFVLQWFPDDSFWGHHHSGSPNHDQTTLPDVVTIHNPADSMTAGVSCEKVPNCWERIGQGVRKGGLAVTRAEWD